MNGKFYDKVARKFGSYSRSITTLDEYLTQDPESLSGAQVKIALNFFDLTSWGSSVNTGRVPEDFAE